MELKDWLQAEMDARGLDPSKLARTSKVPQPTIFRILSGETKDPRAGTVKKLERALGSESPPLEAPTAHHEILEALEYLLPGERAELEADIKRRAAHNKAVGEMLAAKPETAPKAAPKMPSSAVSAGPPTSREKKTGHRKTKS